MAAEQVGKSAVGQAKGLKDQASLAAPAPSGTIFREGRQEKLENITQVGAQGFFQTGKKWVQSDLKGANFDMKVKKYSRAYFQIIEKDPSLGRYFGLGEQVRLQIGSQVVQIDDEGREELTESELKLLFPH